MYCRTLKYRDGIGRFSILVEERPDGSLELWELDVPGGSMRRRVVIEKVADSLAREGRKYPDFEYPNLGFSGQTMLQGEDR